MSKRVLICGATGLLGRPLRTQFESAGFQVTGAGFAKDAELKGDLTDLSEARRVLVQARPDYVVNLVAATNVDQCERDPKAAYLLNAKVVENIALCMEGDTHLLHVSTDQVYDGRDKVPNREAQIHLGNYYAFSKYLGEQFALRAGGTVFRTNFFGKSLVAGRESFTDWLFRALSKKEKITLLTDILFSPLAIDSLCELMVGAISQKKAGIFNLGSGGGMSKAEFGMAFARLMGLGTESVTLATSATFFQNYRPKNMLMNCDLFLSTFGLRLPELAGEIQKIRGEYAH